MQYQEQYMKLSQNFVNINKTVNEQSKNENTGLKTSGYQDNVQLPIPMISTIDKQHLTVEKNNTPINSQKKDGNINLIHRRFNSTVSHGIGTNITHSEIVQDTLSFEPLLNLKKLSQETK